MNVWSDSTYKVVISSITNRELFVNTSDSLFLIPPSFSLDKALEAIVSVLDSDSFVGTRRPSSSLRPYLINFKNIKSKQEFGAALNILVSDGYSIKSPFNKTRISEFLLSLWRDNCLVLPRNCSQLVGKFNKGKDYWYNDPRSPSPTEIITEFVAISTAVSKYEMVRSLLTTMFAIGGVREIGDLTPLVVDSALENMKLGPSLTTIMIMMMKSKYGAQQVIFVPDDYGKFGRQAAKSDNSFSWILQSDSKLEDWRSLAEQWMTLQVRDPGRRRVGVGQFLQYIAADGALPRDPAKYLSTGTSIKQLFDQQRFKLPIIKAVAEFLEWVLNTRFTVEDDNGHPYRLPGYRNPILVPRIRQSRPAESVRDAMPTRFVRRLREIIEADDYAWPKTAFEPGAEDFRWQNPAGQWETVWSPVRAFAILMKLELPERTFQVRVCNSGEADAERYNLLLDRWEPNNSVLAGQMPYGKPMGLARKIKDHHAQKTFTGLYFNTNKTGDLGKSPEDRGHVVPWQHERILALYDRLRTWQEIYNPLVAPTRWSDLKEDMLRKRYTHSTLVDRGAETFLFRDPCSRYPDQPVSHTRMTGFWNKLCGELEERMRQAGETGPGGETIKLVLRDKEGRISGSVYNLHSLRVTMITAWAESGVPVEILMKVAGHATAIMTIYYQKHSISHVTDVLNAASVQTMLDEQSNWQTWIRSKSYDELQRSVAFNDNIGLSSLLEVSGPTVVRRDHGICPVACGRCHEGGPPIDPSSKRNTPVPGGPQNCVRCRFFITGPAFLLGLQSHFDELSFQYREASKSFAASSAALDGLEHQRKLVQAKGKPFVEQARLEVLSSTLDQRTKEVDDLALNWHATYNLIQSCLALGRLEKGSGELDQVTLLAAGNQQDLEFALEVDESGSRTFELLDKICQSSIYFTNIDATTPNLHRMRYFDQLLQRSGYEVEFLRMTEADALSAGNELAQLLYTRFGQQNTNEIMSGSRTLRSLGMDAEADFSNFISKVARRRIAPTSSSKLISGDVR